jgi:manganese transport protein
VIALLMVIFACFAVQIFVAAPPPHAVLHGFVPSC